MPPEASFTPPKKKPKLFWWLGGIALVLGAYFLFQLIGPSPRVVVSKQTTYITTPLLPNGMPNYEEYVRNLAREGVTPQNNAAVLLFQALWPSELQPEQYDAVAAELGLHEIPSAESALQPLYGDANKKRVLDWLPKYDPTNGEPDVDGMIGAAQSSPWSSKQFPPLAAWIEANQKPLDLIVEASRRPRYYSPSPTLLDDQHDMLITMLLPGTQSIREAARGLACRAMWHSGENRLKDAWQDTLALHRLGVLATQGPTMVDQLVAMAIRGMAVNATVALLGNDQLTKDLAHQIQQDLAKITPITNMANTVDGMERIWGLDSVLYARVYGLDALSGNEPSREKSSSVNYTTIDWNVILSNMNRRYDQMASAMRLPKYEDRQKAVADFESKFNDDTQQMNQPRHLIAAAISRNARSARVGSIFEGIMIPAVSAATYAEDRTNSQLQLAQLAAALAVFRVEHGAYPEKLGELVPEVLPALPVDFYHAQSFIYQRNDKGYLLYTAGANGKDDGGSNELERTYQGRELDEMEEAEANQANIPNDADDFSVRLPHPPFKLPKPPAP